MQLNPQNQSKLSDSKFSSISKLVAYEAFLKEKQERKNIEEQRKNIELNVSSLYRQAKKASKELSKTQAAVIQQLNRKSQREQEQRIKLELKKMRKKQLNELKNNNSLARYMNMLKRQQAKRKLLQQNKQMKILIKEREKNNEQMKKIKQKEENKMIKEKNLSLENNLKNGVSLAKVKNLYKKQRLTSIVRSDLLSIQNKLKNQQKNTIEELIMKKKQLSELFSKAKNQGHKYSSLLSEGKDRSFIEMYELVSDKVNYKTLEKKRRKSNGRRKNFSSITISNKSFDEQGQTN